MNKLKISLHPLYIAVGCVFLLTGNLYEFFVYTGLALLHEYTHARVAALFGARTESFNMTPFGARLDGFYERDKKREIAVLLSAPLLNGALCVALFCAWRFFPRLVYYTETVMRASLALALFNLLPAYPLDGGRVLYLLLEKRFGRAGSGKIMNMTALALSVSAILLSAWLFGNGYDNPSALCLALFILDGTDERQSDLAERRLKALFEKKRGAYEVKTVRLTEKLDAPLLLKYLGEDCYTRFEFGANSVSEDELLHYLLMAGEEDDGTFSKALYKE